MKAENNSLRTKNETVIKTIIVIAIVKINKHPLQFNFLA